MQFAATETYTTSSIAVLDRGDAVSWAEPVIADRLRDIYTEAAKPDHALQLIAHHRQLWRNVLLERPTGIAIGRQILQQLGRNARLPAGFIEAVDQAIMEELLEVVLARYQGSRNLVKRYSLLLLAVATDLGAARAAA